ncbi:MAG: hypothetical protein R3E79_17820 [Caldilineaceae bacterium]
MLHASAVACHGAAVAFVGAKGQGKSTMAAALYARGHPLLSDDVVAIAGCEPGLGQAQLTVLAGSPQLKLWPDAAAAVLSADPATLTRLAAGYEKRARCTRDSFSQRPLPLSSIVVLGEGRVPQIKQLAAPEALIQVMGHSYIARFGKQFFQAKSEIGHLQQFTHLINQVPVYTLTRPRTLALLPEVTQLVEEQFCHAINRIHPVAA